MNKLTLKDFDKVPWNIGYCYFCSKPTNNGGNNLCSEHTDILRRFNKQAEQEYIETTMKRLGIVLEEITDIVFDGIKHSDYPDYCDVYIEAATQNGTQLNEYQLDFINESLRDFVYDKLMEYIY